MREMTAFALAILAAVWLWWWLVPEPTRTLPEQFTAAPKRVIERANAKLGNFPKTMEGGVVTWHTSYGRVEVRL